VGLLLSSVGLYGVIAYGVSQRTREIGIRMAIGAGHSAILRSILREGLSLTLIGTALGLAGALATTRLLSTILCGISTTDPLTFAVVPALFVAVAVAATLIPARRAAAIDPIEAMRHE
jgi:putative ABC transport system permease protein